MSNSPFICLLLVFGEMSAMIGLLRLRCFWYKTHTHTQTKAHTKLFVNHESWQLKYIILCIQSLTDDHFFEEASRGHLRGLFSLF